MGKITQHHHDTIGVPQSAESPTMAHKSPTKYQNDDQKPSNYCIKFLINLLIYVICILSLSISLYLSYRHQQLEINVKSLMYLDNRVLRIENDLDDLIRKTNRLYPPTINQNQDETVIRDSIIGNIDELPASVTNDDDTNVSQLPVQVYSEITRLKRDVSNLKIARRQRQTAIQQSPNENCLCPPGES